MMKITKPLLLSILFILSLISTSSTAEKLEIIKSERHSFILEKVASGFDIPWDMTFLPGGDALVTDRTEGRIYRVDIKTGRRTVIKNTPEAYSGTGAGYMGIILHPDYAENGWIYFAYGTGDKKNLRFFVERARLKNGALTDRQVIFKIKDHRPSGRNHFGGRLVLKDGFIFIPYGDEFSHRHLAQDLNWHQGKIMRLHDDGRVPKDNPFVDTPGAMPEIWSLGHRNPQGLILNAKTGDLWSHEHGPKGGDEVNIIRRGANYGWPVITYGEEYRGGPVGDGLTHKAGMEQPVHYYVPSIAPSGMTFYDGDKFSGWQGNLFIGALAKSHIDRLEIAENMVIHSEKLLKDKGWRIRFVRQGPEGYLYFGNDEGDIMRLIPQN